MTPLRVNRSYGEFRDDGHESGLIRFEASGGRRQAGIDVRARCNDIDVVADVAVLDLDSLRAWLRQWGGENIFAETQFALLLGHDLQEIGRLWS
jgi:hypothetical protein